jgi:4-hydroxy-tetrahydrodipicolinate reductase
VTLALAIAGATGRTGRTIVAACADAEGFACSAALASPRSPHLDRDAGELAGVGPLDLSVGPLDGGAPAFDVLVDVSTPAGTLAALELCRERGRPLVIGTTGHDEATLERVRAAASELPIVRAPNLSIGLNVLVRALGTVAGALADDCDVAIVDVHHRHKVDAPSGTARLLDETVRSASGATPQLHSLRIGGRPGDHSVHFDGTEESVTLAHRAHSRAAFARGALRAAAWIRGRPAGLFGMQDVLFGGPPR